MNDGDDASILNHGDASILNHGDASTLNDGDASILNCGHALSEASSSDVSMASGDDMNDFLAYCDESQLSNPESDDPDNIPSHTPFSEKVSEWITHSGVSRASGNKLLHLLRAELPQYELPKDIRTIQHDPREVHCEAEFNGK